MPVPAAAAWNSSLPGRQERPSRIPGADGRDHAWRHHQVSIEDLLGTHHSVNSSSTSELPALLPILAQVTPRLEGQEGWW